jgi:hypothetical protein
MRLLQHEDGGSRMIQNLCKILAGTRRHMPDERILDRHRLGNLTRVDCC